MWVQRMMKRACVSWAARRISAAGLRTAVHAGAAQHPGFQAQLCSQLRQGRRCIRDVHDPRGAPSRAEKTLATGSAWRAG